LLVSLDSCKRPICLADGCDVEEASVFPKGTPDPKAVMLTAVQSFAVGESVL
jgi:hypothetical protein